MEPVRVITGCMAQIAILRSEMRGDYMAPWHFQLRCDRLDAIEDALRALGHLLLKAQEEPSSWTPSPPPPSPSASSAQLGSSATFSTAT